MEEKTLVTGRIRTSNIPSIVASVVALATLMYSIWSDNEVHGSFAHNCMDSFMLFFFVGIPMLILAAIFVLLMNNAVL